MSLIFKMVHPLIYKSKISDVAKNEIKNQVRQVLVYYMGQFVHMIINEDNGIKPRVVMSKPKGKKGEESDDSDNQKEEKKESDTILTPPVKTTLSSTKAKVTPTQAKKPVGRPRRKNTEPSAGSASPTNKKRKTTGKQAEKKGAKTDVSDDDCDENEKDK